MRRTLVTVGGTLFAMLIVLSTASADEGSGFYAGGAIGYGEGSTDWSIPGLFSPGIIAFEEESFNTEPDGILGGVFGGYNHSVNGFVFGVDAGFELTDISASTEVDLGSFLSGGPFDPKQTFEGEVNWLATLRARAGRVFNTSIPFMPYVAAGLSLADFKVSGLIDGETDGIYNPTPQDESETLTGFNVGAGVDIFVSDSIFARIDYQYHVFDDGVSIPGNTGIEIELENIHSIRVGVAIRFN